MAANLETEYLSQLGARVRAWRSQHGMTRKALSAACGVSERYLAQLEAGEGNISVLLLRKVARAMGVPVDSLVREDEAPQDKPIALLGLRGAGRPPRPNASPSSACAARESPRWAPGWRMR